MSWFQHLATHAGFKWNDEILMAMYREDLHSHISMGLSFHHYLTMDDAIQVAYQINENMKSKSYRKLLVQSALRNMMINSRYSNSKVASKSQGSGTSYVSFRPTHNYTPPKS